MGIPRESVEHVARLAHIELSAEEVKELAVELSSVLDHIALLNRVNTDSIAPTSHVFGVLNVLRQDEIKPSWPVEAVLANAPCATEDFFAVTAIFD